MSMLKGIDISSWQKSSDIKWSKLSKQIDFAIIRTGYGSSSNQIDSQFETHMSNAIKTGVKRIGVYHFNYCRSVAEAKIEAQVAIQICQKYKDYISFIAFDWEYDSCDYCKKSGITPTRALVDSMASAFKAEVERAGYKFVLYTNPDYGSRYFTLSKYNNLWIAQYATACSIKNVDIWQYASDGRLDGYSGNLDVDYCYTESLFENWEEKRMATLYKKGDKCIGVLAIKEQLLSLYKLKVIKSKVVEDCVFGDGTESAIKEVQKLAKITVNGQINEATVKAIAKLIQANTVRDIFDTNAGDVNGDGKVNMEDVTDLQKKIAGLK